MATKKTNKEEIPSELKELREKTNAAWDEYQQALVKRLPHHELQKRLDAWRALKSKLDAFKKLA